MRGVKQNKTLAGSNAVAQYMMAATVSLNNQYPTARNQREHSIGY
jgi:hypothetical protein